MFWRICNLPKHSLSLFRRICNPTVYNCGFAIRKQHCLNIYISALSGLQILIVYFGRLQIRRNTQNNSRESLRRTGGGLQIRRNTSFLVPSDLQSDGFQVRICNPQTTLPEHLHKCFERITNPYSIFRRIANPPKHSLPLPPFTQKNPVRRSGARDFRINYLLSLSLISSAPSRLFRQLCARCRCPLRPSCLPGGRLLCR